jgi:hypothetical protein
MCCAAALVLTRPVLMVVCPTCRSLNSPGICKHVKTGCAAACAHWHSYASWCAACSAGGTGSSLPACCPAVRMLRHAHLQLEGLVGAVHGPCSTQHGTISPPRCLTACARRGAARTDGAP